MSGQAHSAKVDRADDSAADTMEETAASPTGFSPVPVSGLVNGRDDIAAVGSAGPAGTQNLQWQTASGRTPMRGVIRRTQLVIDKIHVPGTRDESEFLFVKYLDQANFVRLQKIYLSLRALPAPTAFDLSAIEIVRNELHSRQQPMGGFARLMALPDAQLQALIGAFSIEGCQDFARTDGRLDFLLHWQGRLATAQLLALRPGLANYDTIFDDPATAAQFGMLLGWYSPSISFAVISVILQQPGTAPLLLQGSCVPDVLSRLLAVQPVLLAAVLGAVTPTECLAFADKAPRLNFLCSWYAKLAPTSLSKLASDLDVCDAFLAEPSTANNFGVLLCRFPFDTAVKTMTAIGSEPALAPLLLQSEIDQEVLARLLRANAKQLAALLGATSVGLCTLFAATDVRLQFLGKWHKKIGVAQLNVMASGLTGYDPFFAETETRDQFGALLARFGLTNCTVLLATAPLRGGAPKVTISLLTAVAVVGCTATDLLRCLDVCGELSWGNDGQLVNRILLLQALMGQAPALLAKPVDPPTVFLFDQERPRLLGHPTALANIVRIVLGSKSITIAAESIELLRDFDYDPDLTQIATKTNKKSRAHATEVANQQNATITAIAKTDRENALKSQETAAYESLTKNEKKLSKITSEGAEVVAAKDKLKQRREQFAAGAIAGIDQRESGEHDNVRDVVVPQEYQGKRTEYLAYFTSLNFHPDAEPALDIAKRSGPNAANAAAGQADFALATRIIQMIVAQPISRPLLMMTPIPVVSLKRILNVPALQLAAMLNMVSPVECLAFAATDNRLAFLNVCTSLPATAPRLPALAQQIAVFDPFINDSVESVDFANLLVPWTLPTIVQLLNVCPAYGDLGVGKMAFLRAAMPHADNAATLVSVLKLCGRANWKATKCTSFFTGVGQSVTGPVLLNLARAAIAVEHTKTSSFRRWVDAMNVLLEDGYYTITAGNVIQLGGDTQEVILTIRRLGQEVETFVAHYHHGATTADVDNPNASKYHIKPIRGNKQTPRVYQESIPDLIKAKYHQRF